MSLAIIPPKKLSLAAGESTCSRVRGKQLINLRFKKDMRLHEKNFSTSIFHVYVVTRPDTLIDIFQKTDREFFLNSLHPHINFNIDANQLCARNLTLASHLSGRIFCEPLFLPPTPTRAPDINALASSTAHTIAIVLLSYESNEDMNDQ